MNTKSTSPNTLGRDVDTLRAELAAKAASEGILDVSYRYFDSPVGRLLLAATSAGVVRVAFEVEGFADVMETLSEKVSPRILRFEKQLDPVAHQLEEYFTKRRQRVDVPVDLQLSSGFRRTVLEHLNQVRYGTTATYAELATAAGNPKAFRAAASACSHNPLPLVLPCHRIVKSDGTAGKYLGGDDQKKWLLALEKA